jgi:hypothetical protein
MLGWLTFDETDWMVENGYWIDNRFEAPYERDPNQESQECLDAEAQDHFEEWCIELQDLIECNQGPLPRPEFYPDFGASWEDEIPF